MERISDYLKLNVMYDNGITRVYSIPFDDNVEITKEGCQEAIDTMNAIVKESYKENLSANFTFVDINDKTVTINISKTSSIEFYI